MNLSEKAIFEKALWIWPTNIGHDLHNCYALFRKSFSLEKIPAKAPIHITADQSYRLFVNGDFVCRGPARGYQSHWPYDEVDIRPWIKAGKNLITIRAYNPGHSNFQYRTEGNAGLLLAARWADISTGTKWKCLRQSAINRDTVPTSLQLFCQEHIDLRREEGDWMSPDFDDSAWLEPRTHPWNAGPWFSLEPRGTPILTERKMAVGKLLGTNLGTSAAGYEMVRDVVALRHQEELTHQTVQAGIEPLKIGSMEKGKFRSYLFDFGKTVVGNFTFTIDGAKGGEIIDTLYVETIDQATLRPDLKVPAGCRQAFGDRLICRSGRITHHFYHHYGFRYVVVTARDAVQGVDLGLQFNWTGYPLKWNGSFASSDVELERIWEACAWTQQCCSLDAYVDTPWREQAQWWGDARVQGWNTFYLDGDTRLFRRGIAQIAGQTTPDGLTYGHAPTIAHFCVLPDFTLIWFLTIWDYYWQTESLEPLLAHHEQIQGALAYFRKATDPRSGLLTYDSRYWLFLDWTTIFKEGTPTLYNLWLLAALEKLAILYRKARRPRDAAPLEAWAKKLRVALRRLITPEGLIRDGIDYHGKIVPEASVHAQTLALQLELKGINPKAMFEKILGPFIREEKTFPAMPSAYWITYVFSILDAQGFGKEIISYIKKYWTPMAEHGTTWEVFAPERAEASFSHAWSAHPLYHLMQIVGGVTQTGPGWSSVAFKPTFHGTHSRTVIPTPRGSITSEWKKTGDTVRVQLKLPAGIKARVHLPGLPVKVVVKKQSWILNLKKSNP
jgi:hypothetical protein